MMSPIKEPDLALAGVALLVMFAFLMWHDSPIKNSHLPDPYVQHQAPPSITGDSYESWLWQDPFEYDLNSRTQSDQSSTTCVDDEVENTQNGETAEENHATILAPVLKAPNTLENKEIRTRYLSLRSHCRTNRIRLSPPRTKPFAYLPQSKEL